MKELFANVWSRSMQVQGAFSEHEAHRIYDIACALEKGARIVEIGCYGGKSSLILGMAAKDLSADYTCIDNFITTLEGGGSARKQFVDTMTMYGIKYQLMEMDSSKAAKKYRRKIDLLLIDGDHRYKMVKKDCDLWIPKVKIGGWVVFHDYESSWIGVKQAVKEQKNLQGEEIKNSTIFKRKMS